MKPTLAAIRVADFWTRSMRLPANCIILLYPGSTKARPVTLRRVHPVFAFSLVSFQEEYNSTIKHALIVCDVAGSQCKYAYPIVSLRYGDIRAVSNSTRAAAR
eukprot:5499510-Pleurochrysis_carterae.AAC.1